MPCSYLVIDVPNLMDDKPFVSVIMPIRNEAAYIHQCIDSVLAQDYPPHRMEVLIIDGQSDDGTREIVADYCQKDPRVQLMNNPARTRAPALNIGILNARGDVILRVDGHCWLAPDYVRQCVSALQRTGADNVGGPMRPVGDTPVRKAIALAMTSRFGVGDAKFHHAHTEAFVDTVYLGAFRREALQRVGPFEPGVEPNEDYELNYRLRKTGGRVFLTPSIRSWYTPRSSFRGLALQYLRYGAGKFQMLRRHPRSVRWRQVVAPVFVLALLTTGLGGMVKLPMRALFVGVVGIYAAANFGISTWIAAHHGWRHLARLPPAFAIMHLAWGLGFPWGLLRRG